MGNERKTISATVWKELFAKSGNLCAGPDCPNALFDKHGLHDVSIAHIRGVNEGSARFVPGLAPGELNAAENLLLLCNRHHTMIDACPVTTWTIDAVTRLKTVHEDRVAQLAEGLLRRVNDTAFDTTHAAPDVLTGWVNFVLDSDSTERAEQSALEEVTRDFVNAVQRMPPGARELLAIILDHGEIIRRRHRAEVVTVSIANLQSRVNHPLPDLLRVLDEAGFGSVDDDPPQFYARYKHDARFDILARIQDFTSDRGLRPRDLLVDAAWDTLSGA